MSDKYWKISEFIQKWVVVPLMLLFVWVLAIISAFFFSGGSYEPSVAVIHSLIVFGAFTSVWCLAWVSFFISDNVIWRMEERAEDD